MIQKILGAIKEFKPALLFVGRFLAFYFVGNILYGFYVESFGNQPDNVTIWVAEQSTFLLAKLGLAVTSIPLETLPKISLLLNSDVVINVYEGCNGINVIITFLSFLFAYAPLERRLLWFIPVGVLTLHLSNLIRITGLFFVARDFPNYLYFIHKYLFTGVIYVVVIVMWYLWVSKVVPPKSSTSG